jgi:aminopeptidase-like protein
MIDLIKEDRMIKINVGETLYSWASKLFPINRSLTGPGVRETLAFIKSKIPELLIHEVPSGSKVFDWEVPQEWNVEDAYIITPKGEKICCFGKNNLHLVGYSIPIETEMDLEELQGYLFTLPDMPTAIPYVTSYYKETWGFCLTDNARQKLENGRYKVKIDSSLSAGYLNYGEVLIPGESTKEILISTYICHPSMANNELSGPVVTMMLVDWLKSQKRLRYSYRIVFAPETIGAICYIEKNYEDLKNNVIGGFVVTCVGDNNNYSLLSTKDGNDTLDLIARNVLSCHTGDNYTEYSFLERGSDERQYSSVGIDIPMVSLMRSKYGEYEEYHTSLDNLDFISKEGLTGGYEIHVKMLEILENNFTYRTTTVCEPQLGKRGLYPSISTKSSHKQVEIMMNIIAYADGSKSVIEIAKMLNVDAFKIIQISDDLLQEGLLERSERGS